MFKTIALASALALTAPMASAYNAFPLGESFEATDTFRLGLVRIEDAGVLEIYSYHRHERGRLLGSTPLRAGLNSNVRVHLGLGANTDILLVLNVDGREVLTKDLDRRD